MKKIFYNFKSLANRAKLGFVKGYQTPTLPPHIIAFQNKVFMRIFRVLGGLSIILMIASKSYLPQNYLSIKLIFGILF
jgi:hypothetical protein